MVAADKAGSQTVGCRQWADSTVSVDDLGAVEFKSRQEPAKAAEKVVDLLILAADIVGIVGGDVGRAHQHPAEIFIDEADAPVVRLEIDHAAVEFAYELV